MIFRGSSAPAGQRGQLFQRLLVGARLARDAGPLLDGQLQLVEQHLAQLRQRADVELLPGQRVDLLLDGGRVASPSPRRAGASSGTSRRMPLNSISASTSMSGISRSSYSSSQRAVRAELRLRAVRTAARRRRRPRRRSGRPCRSAPGPCVSCGSWALLADQVGDGDDLVAEVAPGEFVQAVRPLAGVEQVVGDHAVAGDAAHARRRAPAGPGGRT